MSIKIKKNSTKRGDTFIEVMFALAVFSLVAVLSIAMMNAGIATSERSLELVTARNELNAQAEALRFVHNAYTAERNLPECDKLTPEERGRGEKCQRYTELWNTIAGNAKNPYNPDDPNNTDNYSIPSPLTTCKTVYDPDGENKILRDNNAFVLNTRTINNNPSQSYISATALTANGAHVFQEAPLGARLVYIAPTEAEYKESLGNSSAENLSEAAAASGSLQYTKLARAEGIWVVAVKEKPQDGSASRYYDFYIQTCWYGSGMKSPTTLDTIVRLYNPD